MIPSRCSCPYRRRLRPAWLDSERFRSAQRTYGPFGGRVGGPPWETSWGKVMIARRSKTVDSVAFLALATFGALATASAQPADINAIDKAFQDHYARGNYSAAQIDAQELERLVKARFGADHPYYAVALNRLGIVVQAQGKLGEAEELLKRALAI